MILGLDESAYKLANIYLNFNSHEQADSDNFKQSTVYINSEYLIYNSVFKFNTFAWPIPEPFIVFLSIFRESFDSFIIQAYFYKNDGELYKIPNEKPTPITTKNVVEYIDY